MFCTELAQVPVAGTADPQHRARLLEGALARWRGPAFDEFAHEEWAAGTVARLDELHAAATEDHAEALLEAHRWSDAAAELSAHIARHPLRDRPRGLLMRALAGAGRQADALRAARDYRRLLAEEVGTEPSAAVQLIERRVASGWTGTSTTEPGATPGRPFERPAFPTPLSTARRRPIVGRSDLLDQLEDAWGADGWRALIVSGEPGIGKTRLLAELAARMHEAGRHVVAARGDEDYAVTLRPWRDLLGPIVRALPDDALADLDADQRRAVGRIVPAVRSESDRAPGQAADPDAVAPSSSTASSPCCATPGRRCSSSMICTGSTRRR